LYSSPNIIRDHKTKEDGAVGTCITHDRDKSVVGKPERKELLGIPKWEHTIKTNLEEVGCEGVNLIQLSEKWVQTVMNLLVPHNMRNFLTGLATVSFSSKTLAHGFGYILERD
jgi:hypothetical protein